MWDWQDFDGLMFGYTARNLALSDGYYRFLTMAPGSTRVTCGFANNCYSESGFGVTITTLNSKSFDVNPTVVGGAFQIRFLGTLNQSDIMFDPLPEGMIFLVPTKESNTVVGVGDRSETTEKLRHTADGGPLAIA